MIFENHFEPLSDEMDQGSFNFDGNDLFDFAGASCDSDLPPIESADGLSSSFFEDASCFDMEHAQSFSSQESLLDSFASDDTLRSFYSDTSLWGVDNVSQQPNETEPEWPLSPAIPTQDTDIASLSAASVPQAESQAMQCEWTSSPPTLNHDLSAADQSQSSSPQSQIETQNLSIASPSVFCSPLVESQDIAVADPSTSSPPAQTQNVQRDWPSTPPRQAHNNSIASSVTTSSPCTQSMGTPQQSPPVRPIGPIEALWRPLMGYSPPTAQPICRPPKQNKVTKPPKKKKATKTAASKRATSAAAPRERSVQDLYNSTWATLSQEEKGRLLLPLLQDIDPNTGKKATQAGTLLPAPKFKSIGADMSTQRRQTLSSGAHNNVSHQYNNTDYASIGAGYHPLASTQSCSSSVNTTYNKPTLQSNTTACATIGGAYFPPHPSMQPSSPNTNLDAIEAFNQLHRTPNTRTPHSNNLLRCNNVQAITIPDSPEMATNGGAGLGLGHLGSPYYNNNNNMMKNIVQMPAPPAVYGCTRQQEALQRNARLFAQGRRR